MVCNSYIACVNMLFALLYYLPSLCVQVTTLTNLIVTSQNLMRQYAFRQLCSGGLDKDQAKICSRSCVSQRDIQRVFTFHQWLMASYTKYQPYGKRQDYSRRAVLVALGIVYYMRLNSLYRKDYEQYLDKQQRLPNEVKFSKVRWDYVAKQLLYIDAYGQSHGFKCTLGIIVRTTDEGIACYLDTSGL